MIIQQMMTYLQSHQEQYLKMVLQHLKISFGVVLLAVLIGVPLGIWSSRSDRVYRIFSGMFSVLKVIPSLAVLILCIPILGAGEKPAAAALLLLALPTVLINTTLGFRSISGLVLEAASGIGMTDRQRFWQVEVPLALPTVLSGIRTCTVEIISCTTLASYVGAGGLGNLIQIGMSNRFDVLLLGGLSVAVLAVTVDLLLLLVERRAAYYQRA